MTWTSEFSLDSFSWTCAFYLSLPLPLPLSLSLSLPLPLPLPLPPPPPLPPTICLSVCLSVYLSICLSSYLFICLSVCLKIYESTILCCVFSALHKNAQLPKTSKPSEAEEVSHIFKTYGNQEWGGGVWVCGAGCIIWEIFLKVAFHVVVQPFIPFFFVIFISVSFCRPTTF